MSLIERNTGRKLATKPEMKSSSAPIRHRNPCDWDRNFRSKRRLYFAQLSLQLQNYCTI